MSPRSVQLVLHYDGAGFSGWQRQPDTRTVQGVLEDGMRRLCQEAVPVLGAGRTDAGVHARGQAAGVRVSARWTAPELRRALNAVLPADVWVAAAYEMQPTFHARFDATARRYSYRVGLDDAARSPFRRRWCWPVGRPLDIARLADAAALLPGRHVFRAFAVKGTAPAEDDHTCHVTRAEWSLDGTDAVFHVEANRFLHHMVRFLVGTMVEIAAGRRPAADLPALLSAPTNDETSPPAPPDGLVLEQVTYPSALYLEAA
jgi:tRNA pseudouridine38-40 synthase